MTNWSVNIYIIVAECYLSIYALYILTIDLIGIHKFKFILTLVINEHKNQYIVIKVIGNQFIGIAIMIRAIAFKISFP